MTTEVPAVVDPTEGVLNEAKGKFRDVLVIGLTPSGQLDINTTRPDYAFLQWVLERAKFELLLHEKATLTSTPKEIEVDQ